MRFNKADLIEGNISQERLREVVKEMVTAADINDQGLLKEINLIANSPIIKLVYNRDYHEIEASQEKFDHTKNLEKIVNFNTWVFANQILMEIESKIEFYQFQEKRVAIEELSDRIQSLKKEQSERSAIETTQALQLAQAQLLQLLNEERAHLIIKLKALYQIRENLKSALSEIGKVKQASREHHTNNMMQHIQDVIIDGEKIFKSDNPNNLREFLQGVMLIEELFEKEIIRLQAEISAERQRLMKDGTVKPGMLTQSKTQSITSPMIKDLEKQLSTAQTDRINCYRTLAERNNLHKFTGDNSDKTIERNINAFHSDPNIKQAVDAHLKTAKECDQQEEAILERTKQNDQNINQKSDQIGQRTDLLAKLSDGTLVESAKMDRAKNIDIDETSDNDIDIDDIDLADLDLDDLDDAPSSLNDLEELWQLERTEPDIKSGPSM